MDSYLQELLDKQDEPVKHMLDLKRNIFFNFSGEYIIPIKNASITSKAIETLNEDQLKVFVQIMGFLQNPDPEKAAFFSLRGYAGTGKTYLIGKVAHCIDGQVAVSAPTNKAVKVLSDNREDLEGRVDLLDPDDVLDNAIKKSNINYATIHKLLALRVKWVYPKKGEEGEPKQTLVRKYGASPSVNEYLILVIDEASMFDDDLFVMLNRERSEKLKIIFMGDPAQIPPVNKVDSIPLLKEEREKWNIQDAVLEKIMRQKSDNKILELAYQVRNGRFRDTDPILSRISNKDVTFYNSMKQSDKSLFITTMVDHFKSDEFDKDSNHCKVIAWTNKVVDLCNEIIRRSIFKSPKLDKIMLGEKLIADKPVFNEDREIIFNTSDEFTVENIRLTTTEYDLPEKGSELLEQLEMEMKGTEIEGVKKKGDFTFKLYDCDVRTFTTYIPEGYISKIQILHEDSQKAFWYAMKKLKERKNWDEYTRMLERFAMVKYNYAITAHKSQGSTYKIVFLMEDDIDNNRKTLERNRIKYTACTRPKEKLHILSKYNPTLEKQNAYLAKANAQ